MQFRRNRPPTTTAASTPAAAPELPSFDGLSERESLFVVEYTSRSGTRGAGADAALAAGYSNGNRDAAHSMASKLLRRPHVLRAIKDETGRRIAASAPLGVAVLEQLAQSARSEQVRLAAANSLVDRGFGPVVSRNASVSLTAKTSLEDLLDRAHAQEEAERRQAADNMVGVTPRGTPDVD